MNNKPSIVAIILVFMVALFTQSSSAKKLLHSNRLEMVLGKNRALHEKIDAVDIQFEQKSFCITKGQPFDGKAFVWRGKDVWYLEVVAGRHASRGVASCFAGMTGNSSEHIIFNHLPKALNFAVIGTLTIQVPDICPVASTDKSKCVKQYIRFDDFVVAQGHSGSTNNWWIGGKNCSYVKPRDVLSKVSSHYLQCTSADKKVTWCFRQQRVDVNTIHITGETCNAAAHVPPT